MVTAPPVSCARHRRRGSIVRCSTCDAPMCAECIVKTPVGFKCRSCVGGAAVPAGGASRRRPGVVAVAAAAVVAVGLVAWLVARGGPGDGGGDGRAGALLTGERPVEFNGAGGVPIAGTLRVPRAATGAPVPVVLIIGGFGNTTRDGVLSGDEVGDPLYRELSAALADAGIASYRYDHRGTGQSVLPADTPLQLADMVGDARAALGFLAERREVDPKSIAVVGHGGGGLVALQVATDPRVKRVVLLSTPGRPLVDVFADDFARSGHAAAAEQAQQVRAVVEQLRRQGDLPPLDTLQPEVRPVFAEGGPSWLRAMFSIDPVADARQVAVPVLIVQGARDTGLVPADAEQLRQALGGHTDVIVDPDADNTFNLPPPTSTGPSPEGAGHDRAMGAASASSTRDTALLGQVVTWLRDGLLRTG